MRLHAKEFDVDRAGEVVFGHMNRNAGVWLLMVGAVGVHVVDEAVTGFLPFYNGVVLRLRDRLGFFPAPTFTFRIWITGLALAVTGGVALTPLVARGGRSIRFICGALALLMFANGLGHTLGSLYFGRILPGFWSSPLLLLASSWMMLRAFQGWSNETRGA